MSRKIGSLCFNSAGTRINPASNERKNQIYSRPHARLALQPKFSTHFFHKAANDAQTQTSPLAYFLRGKEGVRHFR